LWYANVPRFVDQVTTLIAEAKPRLKWFVFDAAETRDIDYSAAEAIVEMMHAIRGFDVQLVITNLHDDTRATILRYPFLADEAEKIVVFTSRQDAIAAYREFDGVPLVSPEGTLRRGGFDRLRPRQTT
jgi:MFS superfamily sulfate permease-like transporter